MPHQPHIIPQVASPDSGRPTSSPILARVDTMSQTNRDVQGKVSRAPNDLRIRLRSSTTFFSVAMKAQPFHYIATARWKVLSLTRLSGAPATRVRRSRAAASAASAKPEGIARAAMAQEVECTTAVW